MKEIPKTDSAAIKARQRAVWSRIAQGWERWWDTFERAAQDVSERLVELAGVAPGHRVLDLATGIGEPALTAARRVGSTGQVVGVDQAPMMLALARRRMASLGLPNVEFVEGDLDALGLDQHFDAIVSRWGLMFSLDLDGTLRKLVERLVPGGRFAAAVWAEPDRIPLISVPARVALDALGLSEPPPGAISAFNLSDAGRLLESLASAGLTDLVSERRTVTFEAGSAEEMARFIRETSPVPPELEQLAAARQKEIWDTVAAALRRFARPDGSIAIPNEALLVAGVRPGEAGDLDIRTSEARQVRCPFCGGSDTRLESAFGSTLGFAQYWCGTCRTVFEYLKWEEDGGAIPA
jgi:ubiquinone/menaquinone biosynthesis C-methylase UbiE